MKKQSIDPVGLNWWLFFLTYYFFRKVRLDSLRIILIRNNDRYYKNNCKGVKSIE